MSHMTVRSDAGSQIRHARWAKKLSIRRLARLAKISPSTVVKVEKGNTSVLPQVIYALAEALELNPTTLFEKSEVAS